MAEPPAEQTAEEPAEQPPVAEEASAQNA
jgi:hypothetical protein